MTTVMTDRHTYQNIKRTGEFCLNFLPPKYVEQCQQTIHPKGEDEFVAVGFTP